MKKILLCLLFVLFSFRRFAQKTEVFYVDSLPKERLVLGRGWKWHHGDDPQWVEPDFDDSA